MNLSDGDRMLALMGSERAGSLAECAEEADRRVVTPRGAAARGPNQRAIGASFRIGPGVATLTVNLSEPGQARVASCPRSRRPRSEWSLAVAPKLGCLRVA